MATRAGEEAIEMALKYVPMVAAQMMDKSGTEKRDAVFEMMKAEALKRGETVAKDVFLNAIQIAHDELQAKGVIK
jgi:hypothetical protein